MRTAELLAPAGDFETALAAFEAGADAVYCGLSNFSARAFAKNFSIADLKNLMRVARAKNRRVYVTFNTIVDEGDREDAIRRLSELNEIKPSALIIQDLGIAKLCRKHFPDLELHASTQLVAHNLEGVMALKELGFTRVVLARELSLEEISSIAKRCGNLELECFIHGALCYSISGLCLFSALEKGRSGNRGACAYCCRLPYATDEGVNKVHPFSMKDLRLGEDVRKLVDAGVKSLKIEGRMKSALYVAAVVKHYRNILDQVKSSPTIADLETVFSRRTTKLYFDKTATGEENDVIDATSLGHLGTPIGIVKRVTFDREGRAWLRFHTSRALEKHDGLQFESPEGGKPLGLGITELRAAISRTPVFEVAAGTDVEVLLPLPDTRLTGVSLEKAIRPGMTVYCSMSNAVKRMFPMPSFRPSDYQGVNEINLEVEILSDKIIARVDGWDDLSVEIKGEFTAAKNPEKTEEAIRKSFSKLGDTDYSLKSIKVKDFNKLFAPMSILNDLRRDLIEKLDDANSQMQYEGLRVAIDDDVEFSNTESFSGRNLRVRVGQKIPKGEWSEIIIAIDHLTTSEMLPELRENIRLAMPVYTGEGDYHSLRLTVKRLLRAGFTKWEASDLSTLRLLREVGIEDITADWTLYAFNASALSLLAELGVKRVVASPENNEENLRYLSECGFPVEFLEQQATPLFISLTRPKAIPESDSGLVVYRQGKLWVTTKALPRSFTPPKGVATRIDLSWNH